MTGTVPTPVELFRQRSTTGNDSAYLMEHLSYEDPYDTLLYQQASRIFEEELAYVKQWKGLDL